MGISPTENHCLITAHVKDQTSTRRVSSPSEDLLVCDFGVNAFTAKVGSPIHLCVEACRWRRIAQIKATDVQRFLANLRDEGLSVQTSNHYLRAIKCFTRWLTINRRLRSNPLDGLAMLNVRVDRRHDRRALSRDEFWRLVDAANSGPVVESIPGIDRAMLYVLAAWTGLRKGEIGSLTPASFRFTDDPPTVTVAAAYSKHRREDTQVLHPEVVTRLREWLQLRQPADDEILFPISKRTCGLDRKTAKMMREDLAAARRVWLAETDDPAERRRRLQSDFLKYKDSQNRFADFHANRHTFITNLCLVDQSAAIARLPGVGGNHGVRGARSGITFAPPSDGTHELCNLANRFVCLVRRYQSASKWQNRLICAGICGSS